VKKRGWQKIQSAVDVTGFAFGRSLQALTLRLRLWLTLSTNVSSSPHKNKINQKIAYRDFTIKKLPVRLAHRLRPWSSRNRI
jgi:hypothetical protein